MKTIFFYEITLNICCHHVNSHLSTIGLLNVLSVDESSGKRVYVVLYEIYSVDKYHSSFYL